MGRRAVEPGRQRLAHVAHSHPPGPLLQDGAAERMWVYIEAQSQLARLASWAVRQVPDQPRDIGQRQTILDRCRSVAVVGRQEHGDVLAQLRQRLKESLAQRMIEQAEL